MSPCLMHLQLAEDSSMTARNRTKTPAPSTPSGSEKSGRSDSSRNVRVWRTWLAALGSDADAAQAAALAYRELDDRGRDAWIESLSHDAQELGVPRIAVYAPLLAVEADVDRRKRIELALGDDHLRDRPREPTRALVGQAAGDVRVAVLISPLYMRFVQVLACGYRPGTSIEWVRHDPIVLREAAVRAGDRVVGAKLEDQPLDGVVDQLALAIVAHGRKAEVPEALKAFAHVFGPSFA